MGKREGALIWKMSGKSMQKDRGEKGKAILRKS